MRPGHYCATYDGVFVGHGRALVDAPVRERGEEGLEEAPHAFASNTLAVTFRLQAKLAGCRERVPMVDRFDEFLNDRDIYLRTPWVDHRLHQDCATVFDEM